MAAVTPISSGEEGQGSALPISPPWICTMSPRHLTRARPQSGAAGAPPLISWHQAELGQRTCVSCAPQGSGNQATPLQGPAGSSPEGLTQSALALSFRARCKGQLADPAGESMAGPGAGSSCPSPPSTCLSFLTCEIGKGHCLLSRLAAGPGASQAGLWEPQRWGQVLSQPQRRDMLRCWAQAGVF